jgi:hypothetical protein
VLSFRGNKLNINFFLGTLLDFGEIVRAENREVLMRQSTVKAVVREPKRVKVAVKSR